MKTKTPIILFTLVLSAIGFMAWAVGPNDTRITQRNANNSTNMFRDLPVPAGGVNAIMGFNGATVRPQYFLIGAGLTSNGTTISATATAATKESIGLGNVDNTSDATKPVSTPQQAALNAKANTSSLALVATSGSYADLVNKPSLATVATSGSYGDLLGKPSNVSQFTNDAGYITSLALSPYATTNSLTTGLAGKFNTPTGTTAQYIRGDGSLATMPSTAARSFNMNSGRTLVTVAAAANGFQVDASRDALVNYSVTINTTSTLTGGSAGYVVLEVSPTNSATAASWIEISRTSAGQMNGLVVGLTLNQVNAGNISGVIQAGYFARLRSVNLTTTAPIYTINSQQEVKL